MAEDKLRPISLDDLDRLGINNENELCWDGRRVEVASRLNLTRRQTAGAILVGVDAVLGGLASALNDGTEFTCRQWHVLCGYEPSAAAKATLPGGKAKT